MSKRPWQYLPMPPPNEVDHGPYFFYKNFALPISKDLIRLMNNGLHIDQEAVTELRNTLDTVLDSVEKTLASDPIIESFQAYQYPKKFAEYKEKVTSSCRTLDYYLKEFDPSSMAHRTYVMNTYLGVSRKIDYKDKWTIKELKAFNQYAEDEFIDKLINKTLSPDNIYAKKGMKQLAKDKVDIYNKVRTDKVDSVTKSDLIKPFNPGSSKDKIELFEFLGVEPISFTDGGKPQWSRANIEEVLLTAPDEWKNFLQAFIDHSFSAIVKSNFIEGFDKFTIDGVLRGNFKTFGAKSFRPTSNSINLLNTPSTGSIYAKPLKKCIVAPEGYLVWSIDYSALEDRVIANLSKDVNKLSIFTEGLDGHSLASTYYFKDKVTKLIGSYTDHKAASIKLKALVDEKNPEAKAIRQSGKPVTFGLSYGSFPKKVASSIKCSLEEAEQIFDSYHNEMFPGITTMREAAISKASKDGYLHLGLGCRMYSDDVGTHERTLFNALSQFWSILTLIALNELHYEIDKAGLQDNVQPNATIYDALYGIVKATPESIKWLNDTICPIMEKDFVEGQIVHNEAALEIGTSWADLTELPKDASLDYIKGVINEMV